MSMRIVLATGIYPPQIGGPATYAFHLARELAARGAQVTVVTYGDAESGHAWQVVSVARHGNVLRRWFRYAAALRAEGKNADIVYAFSSVSCGMPLMMARLPRHVRTFLRLGGDFLWERYTDRGGRKPLREWHAVPSIGRFFMRHLLRSFHHIVYSTAFQRDLYAAAYRGLPPGTVIENAVSSGMLPRTHGNRDPFRLLTFSRLVRFKNVDALLRAMVQLPDCLLTVVGEGPDKARLQRLVQALDLDGRVAFVDTVPASGKQELFDLHEALIVPSLTDISPNAALEARAAGLPVLLTQETGLAGELIRGMMLAPLETPDHIVRAIQRLRAEYPQDSAAALPLRTWTDVADEHLSLFRQTA